VSLHTASDGFSLSTPCLSWFYCLVLLYRSYLHPTVFAAWWIANICLFGENCVVLGHVCLSLLSTSVGQIFELGSEGTQVGEINIM
jgi:hypothetical protein